MLKRISNKIIAAFTLLLVLLVVFFLLFFNNLVRETQLSILKREMKAKVDFIDMVIKERYSSFSLEKLKKNRHAVGQLAKIIQARISIIDQTGIVLADSEVDEVDTLDNHRYRIEIKNAQIKHYGDSVRYSTTLQTDMLYYAKAAGPVILRLAKPLYEIEESLSAVKKVIIFSGIFVLFTAFLIIIYISRKITRPINETVNFAREFSHGDYSRRILNYSEDEIGYLQRSLNSMADTIVEKINSLVFEQNKLEITLESISDGIAVVDENKRVHIANSAFSRMVNSDCEMKGSLYFEAIRSHTLNAKIEYVLGRGVAAKFEEKFMSGTLCEVSLNPIKERNTLQGILVVLHDVTEKRRIEQIKTELVGNMSHELKTPLAIMKGYLETISENIQNAELSSEFIQKAIENADRQNAIINDILKLSMLETSSDFLVEKINLKEVIETCIDLLSPKAAGRNITIQEEVNVLDAVIKGNRFLSEEVFFNIIDNAVNYNRESGTVTIHAEKGRSSTLVTIKDTGIGIPEDSLDRIFERFYRVDKSRSRATGGTGLGLSIVKHAADLLGWRVTASTSKEGTSFTIEI